VSAFVIGAVKGVRTGESGITSYPPIIQQRRKVLCVCTRVLWNDNGLAVVTGRTMDWPESGDPILTVLPRTIR
jgi:penicillin V acylase-like amidase (Ntn superfamily)